MLLGLAGGAVGVAVASLVLAVVDPDNAIQDATSASRAKLRGLTENPNELSMLMAFALPLALWPLAHPRVGRRGLGRQHEGRLGVVQLAGDSLHLVVG
jgi:hypothetical protein